MPDDIVEATGQERTVMFVVESRRSDNAITDNSISAMEIEPIVANRVVSDSVTSSPYGAKEQNLANKSRFECLSLQ